MKRILMLALVLALLATVVISTATFACGAAGNATQARNGTYAQYGAGNGAGDGTGPICLDQNGDGVCGK